MLEQRNKFINNMNNCIDNHKKQFHTILSKLGWSLQSVTGTFNKDEHNDETNDEQENQTEGSKINDTLKENDETNDDESTDIKKSEEQKEEIRFKDRTLCLGTSKDSEQLYNELLASLSFQPKVKKENLSDTELLASLLETERNAKRRRISYRNKIHTKNKSHTEVLREVIREQMEVLTSKEDETEDDKCNPNEKKEDNDEMIEINVTDGNPHLAWQTVGVVIGGEQHKLETQHNTHNQRFDDSHTTNNWPKTTDHHNRKYHHSRYSSFKHNKSPSYYRDKSPKHRISSSSKDRKRKTHDRERSSKSHSSKYVEKSSSGRDKSPRHRHKKKKKKSSIERRSNSKERESTKSRNKRKLSHSDK